MLNGWLVTRIPCAGSPYSRQRDFPSHRLYYVLAPRVFPQYGIASAGKVSMHGSMLRRSEGKREEH